MIPVLLPWQSFLIVSDPAIAKHILRENSKAYSKVRLLLIYLPVYICFTDLGDALFDYRRRPCREFLRRYWSLSWVPV
jgi:hypothetical protein